MLRGIGSDAKENTRFGISVGCWWFIALVLLAATAFVWLYLFPTFRDMWFEGFRSSNEYVTTKQSMLVDLMLQYEKLDTKIVDLSTNPDNADLVESMQGQQKAIIDRMEKEAALIDADQVPADVQRFLASK